MRTCCVLVFFALSAAAQLPTIAFSGGGGGAPDGSFQGNATFRIPLTFTIVTNAPYSGEQTEELAQTLADGSQSTQPGGMHQKALRDSQGRIRIEQPYVSGPTVPKGSPTLVEIVDPVGGYAYILDDVNRVAHRIKLPTDRQAPVANGIRLPMEQDLGTQTIDGVLLEGKRSHAVVHEGAEGNAAAVSITTDRWTSHELQLVVLTVTNDPRKGVTTSRIVNLKTSDPSQEMFQAPADYQVVDESATFTITWSSR